MRRARARHRPRRAAGYPGVRPVVRVLQLPVGRAAHAGVVDASVSLLVFFLFSYFSSINFFLYFVPLNLSPLLILFSRLDFLPTMHPNRENVPVC